MLRRLVLVSCLAFCLPVAEAQGPPKEVQKLEKQLKDRDSSVRARAAWDLGEMRATGSVPALVEALDDPSSAVRANAAASLWKLGAASKPAMPALRRLLEDRSGAVVGNAAGALRNLGVPMAELVPAYRRLLAEPDCKSAVIGLKALADEAPPAELFDAAWRCAEAPDAEFDTRRDAREALRKVAGRRDRVMVPRILETLRHLDGRDGSDLMSAVASLDPPVKEAVPVLAGLLVSGNASTRRSAASTLGRMGVAALPAVPELVDRLQHDDDQETRVAAAEALGGIGPKCAATAVPVLAKAARDDKWPKVRKHVDHRARRDGAGGEGGDPRAAGGPQGPGRLDQRGGEQCAPPRGAGQGSGDHGDRRRVPARAEGNSVRRSLPAADGPARDAFRKFTSSSSTPSSRWRPRPAGTRRAAGAGSRTPAGP